MFVSREVSTNSYQGPVINVSTWIMLIIASLAVIAKISSKWYLLHKIQLDDVWIFFSMISAVGYVVALLYQVEAGLGQSITLLDSEQRAVFGKAAYASETCYVLSLGLAKWALLQFLLTLSQKASRRTVTLSVIYFNAITVVTGAVPILFQCSLPIPWDVLSGQCFNRTAFWASFGSLHILLDGALVALPVYLLHDLNMKKEARVKAILAFVTRTSVIPVIVVRLVYIGNSSKSTDRTLHDYLVSVTTSVHMSLSIITACVPFLRPVMESLQNGVLVSDLRTVRAGTSPSFRLRDFPQPSHNSGSTDTKSVADSIQASKSMILVEPPK